MLVRGLVVTLILSFMNLYIANRFKARIDPGNLWACLSALFFFLFFVAQMFWPVNGFILRGLLSGSPLIEMLTRISFVALGIFSCLLIYTMARDLVYISLSFISKDAALRFYGLYSLIFVMGLTSVNVLVGLSGALSVPVVHRLDVPLAKLTPAFDGLTIAQLSDIHIDSFLGKDFLDGVAKTVKELNPDMLVLTGDIADTYSTEGIAEIAALREITPPYGKYYVTGNHEYYWDAKGWESAMTQTGFTVLTNSHSLIEKDGQHLAIAGVPDPTSVVVKEPPLTNFAAARAGIPDEAVKIILSHQPQLVRLAQQEGFDLQLSGHTHAGQYFPFTLIIRLFQKYTHGLYNVKDMKLYVNKGTGFWGPPLRTGGAGEITLLTLRARKE